MMMKFFLVGWVCLGTVNVDYQCVRMASGVVHDTFESCSQYYDLFMEDMAGVGADLKFTCVQAGLLEDIF
jgi:hypothetical protein